MGGSYGANKIVKERSRQIEQEGWSLQQDRAYEDGDLAAAAAYLASASTGFKQVRMHGRQSSRPIFWWELLAIKHNNDRIRQLEIAGALIAAEIDRMHFLELPPISITYFKDTGKYYSDAGPLAPEILEALYDGSPRQVVKKLNYERQLPGLHRGVWEGYVHVTVGDVPHMVDLREDTPKTDEWYDRLIETETDELTKAKLQIFKVGLTVPNLKNGASAHQFRDSIATIGKAIDAGQEIIPLDNAEADQLVKGSIGTMQQRVHFLQIELRGAMNA